MIRTEDLIISNLLYNEEFARVVLPNTDFRYFDDKFDNMVVRQIHQFFSDHSKLPTKKILAIELSKAKNLSDDEMPRLGQYLKDIEKPDATEEDWLLKEAEEFYKKKAVYNAIMDSISILDSSKKEEDSIPTLLSEALSVSFDKSIGHDYFEDAESRFEFYHRKEERIPLGLEIFNKITKGGLPKKTLSVWMASTGVGKSLFMCDYATACVKMGYNVLYITLEMAEERIAERLDMNLLDLDNDDLYKIDKKTFMNKFKAATNNGKSKLIVKQYPTASAHAGHFRALIKELKIKKKFKPDIVFVDYLNICASSRIKSNGNVNSYTLVKSVAEEIRALAVEFDCPFVSATQTNRNGFNNTEVELTDTSESMGLTHTVDFMCALVSTEEMEAQNQIMVKQLKNRYNRLDYYRKFVVGIDRNKMRLYDVDSTAQAAISGQHGQNITFKPKSSSQPVPEQLPWAVDEDDGIPVFDRGQGLAADGWDVD